MEDSGEDPLRLGILKLRLARQESSVSYKFWFLLFGARLCSHAGSRVTHHLDRHLCCHNAMLAGEVLRWSLVHMAVFGKKLFGEVLQVGCCSMLVK